MEIEAKFSFLDDAAFNAWLERDRLGPYVLEPPRLTRVLDCYLDTATYDCLAAGYACRVRTADGREVATLKSLADAVPGSDGVRRRDELEVELAPGADDADVRPGCPAPDRQQPAAWPESPARALALRLTDSRPLLVLTKLRQERFERDVRDDHGRLVAQLSLDRVSFANGTEPIYELECELRPDGTEEDLARIVAALRAEHVFAPQPRSKLARALAGVPLPPAVRRALLRGRERDTPDIAALARTLAEAAPGWSPRRRHLLERALALLDEAERAEPDAPAATARDLLLAGEAAEGDGSERRTLAAAFALLALCEERARKRGVPLARPSKKDRRALRDVAGLDAAAGEEARALAALLHIALALSRAGVEAIPRATVTERTATLYVAAAAIDDELARGAAAIWADLFDVDLALQPESTCGRWVIGLHYAMPLAAAGRRIVAVQRERLLDCLEALRRDADDVEALHDARVAARRMRAALQLLRAAYPDEEVRPLSAGLRALTAALGGVRDLDVQIGWLERDATAHGEDAAALPVLVRLRQERATARAALLAWLDGAEHRALLDALTAFLDAPAAERPGQRRLCDTVPALLWRLYGRMRGRGATIAAADDTALHELRKDVRRLRYALEFFRELLGDEAGDLVRQTVAMQDALGALHDTVVLAETLQRTGAEEAALVRVRALLTLQRREALARWPALTEAAFRQKLGRCCARL